MRRPKRVSLWPAGQHTLARLRAEPFFIVMNAARPANQLRAEAHRIGAAIVESRPAQEWGRPATGQSGATDLTQFTNRSSAVVGNGRRGSVSDGEGSTELVGVAQVGVLGRVGQIIHGHHLEAGAIEVHAAQRNPLVRAPIEHLHLAEGRLAVVAADDN